MNPEKSGDAIENPKISSQPGRLYKGRRGSKFGEPPKIRKLDMYESTKIVYELIRVSFPPPPPGGFLQTYLIWKSII